jgi:RNA polymerase sigma factor (sigma-70 family)
MGQIPPVNPNAAAQFDPCSDPFTTSLIRKKVALLIRVPPFSAADRDDLYQELLSAVVKSAGNIDAEIGHRNPYITTVVERQLYTIRQRHQAIKRDPSGVASLNVLTRTADGERTELIQTLDDRDADRRSGRERRRSEAELTSLRLDLARAIADLPPEWQRMLELCKSHSLSEVARQMDVPRTTLGNWMREIRTRFAELGLEKYFEI